MALSMLVSLAGPSRPALAEYAFEVMKNFKQPTYRASALILGRDGALYGTSGVGLSNAGTVFRIDGKGNYATLHVGDRPTGGLVQATDGSLYGVTSSGGSQGVGTLFKIDSSGVFISLHSFGSAGGGTYPRSLTQGSDGALYGASFSTVFKVDSAGNVSSLHSFAYGTSVSALTLGSDAALYGATREANTTRGTIFRIDSAGTVTTLREFDSADGLSSATKFTLGADDALYGIQPGSGFTYRIDVAGDVTRWPSFIGSRDGFPGSALTLGSDGALYGTTVDGYLPTGPSGGTVFRIDSAGTVNTLHTFTIADEAENGLYPGGTPLTLGSDGALYGATQFGGQSGRGTVFRISNSATFSTLHSFDEEERVEVYADALLAVGNDGVLYGITSGYSGGGMVFRIDSAGTFTRMHSLASDGSNPSAALVVGSDGALYGSTLAGGSSDAGTVFRIDSTGTFTSLLSLPSRAQPTAAELVVGSDGALYGSLRTVGFVYCGLGDCPGGGGVFKVEPDGTYAWVGSFGAFIHPGPLTLGADGALWGTALGSESVFRIDNAGTFTSVHTFDNYDDGANPAGHLTVGSDGALCGTL